MSEFRREVLRAWGNLRASVDSVLDYKDVDILGLRCVAGFRVSVCGVLKLVGRVP